MKTAQCIKINLFQGDKKMASQYVTKHLRVLLEMTDPKGNYVNQKETWKIIKNQIRKIKFNDLGIKIFCDGFSQINEKQNGNFLWQKYVQVKFELLDSNNNPTLDLQNRGWNKIRQNLMELEAHNNSVNIHAIAIEQVGG